MDAEKRRELRRRAAQERVASRQEEGGDDAVVAAAEEQRLRQLDSSVEAARAARRAAASGGAATATKRRRTRNPDPGIHTRTLGADELRELNEQRDLALAGPARQKAAIKGLVPFEHDEFVERLRDDETDRAEHCSFATCAKSPKWMAPARAEGDDHFLWVVCNEHVAPRA